MWNLNDVPDRERKGTIRINGHEIMAFLADFREDGGIYVAEDILDACGNGDVQRVPVNFIQANRSYLDELARVSKCEIVDLIGVRKDGRYWCTHQVAVAYARWLNPRVAVLVDRMAIEFAKTMIPGCIQWVEKRGKRAITVNLYGNMVKKLPTPKGKDDSFKYACMNAAIQDQIQGSKTAIYKQLNNVQSAADAYSNAMLDADMLARSITVSNVERKNIDDLWVAHDEAKDNATKIAALAKQLLTK